MRKIHFILEIVVTISILCFFSIANNHFILPIIDYIRFLQMLPGKYINESPYDDDYGDMLIYKLKDQYRLHFKNHKSIDEIYSCEASDNPCYVSVDVWLLSDDLGAALTYMGEREDNVVSKILVDKSFGANWNVEQNQTLLIKSAATTINAEVSQLIPYSGFPEYERESRAAIFLISSELGNDMVNGEVFSINSTHIVSLREFDISELIRRAEDYVVIFYIIVSLVLFCWIICCVIINWKINEFSRYILHLYMLGAAWRIIRIKKSLFLLSSFLSSALPGCIAIVAMNDVIAELYFVIIVICYLFLFFWVLIK